LEEIQGLIVPDHAKKWRKKANSMSN